MLCCRVGFVYITLSAKLNMHLICMSDISKRIHIERTITIIITTILIRMTMLTVALTVAGIKEVSIQVLFKH